MVRIGIVGTGRTVGIADYHVAGLTRDGRAEVSAIFNSHRETSESWISKYSSNAKIVESYTDLLDSVDAVCICAPNQFHADYVEGAVLAGKHFIVEKPLAVGIDKCRKLADISDHFNGCGMVGFVYRYSNAVNTARKIVHEHIGQVYTLSAWFGGKRLSDPTVPMEWRMKRSVSGYGALGDFGSHLIDLADYVAAQRYNEVSCISGISIPFRTENNCPKEVENDDSSVVIARSKQGIGNFTMSRVGMDDVMILVTGEGGMLQLSLRGEGSVTYWEKESTGGYSGKVISCDFEPQIPFSGWFDGEMTAFLDAIEGRRDDIPDVRQALYVEEMLYSASLSAKSGKIEAIGS